MQMHKPKHMWLLFLRMVSWFASFCDLHCTSIWSAFGYHLYVFIVVARFFYLHHVPLFAPPLDLSLGLGIYIISGPVSVPVLTDIVDIAVHLALVGHRKDETMNLLSPETLLHTQWLNWLRTQAKPAEEVYFSAQSPDKTCGHMSVSVMPAWSHTTTLIPLMSRRNSDKGSPSSTCSYRLWKRWNDVSFSAMRKLLPTIGDTTVLCSGISLHLFQSSMASIREEMSMWFLETAPIFQLV